MWFNPLLDFISGKVYPTLLVLFFFGLTIFIHELGHFLVAKRRGMKIERFSIGFGPKLFGWMKDGIDYRVSWLPFGGYVALPQMSPMEALEGKTETKPEELSPAPPGSKILVALAGPILNLGLAVALAAVIWAAGLPMPVNPSIVGWVEAGSREEQLGIRPGDHIVQVDDRPVKTWMDIQRAVAVSLEPNVRVIVDRNGARQEYLLETQIYPQWGVKTLNLYPQGRPVAESVEPRSPAEHAGLEAGDKFLSVEGVPLSTAKELIDLIAKQADKPTELKVLRNGKVVTLVAIPEVDPAEKRARIGVKLGDEMDYQVVWPGPTVAKQFADVMALMGDTVYALAHHKQTGVGLRSVSGPVGIATNWWMQITRGGWRRGMWFAVLLNINLAILNLLPLPVLDGGHVIFSLIEAWRHKPVNPRLQHAMSLTFAVLLISFMLYVTVFDIRRFIPDRKPFHSPAPTQTAPASTP